MNPGFVFTLPRPALLMCGILAAFPCVRQALAHRPLLQGLDDAGKEVSHYGGYRPVKDVRESEPNFGQPVAGRAIGTWSPGKLKPGDTTQVTIHSQRGLPCRLQNPWPGQQGVVFESGKGPPLAFRKEPGDVIGFNTQPGMEFVVCRLGTSPVTVPTIFTSSPNTAPKKLGATRMLGIGRGFES